MLSFMPRPNDLLPPSLDALAGALFGAIAFAGTLPVAA
jgi:hypothetical protein